MAERLQKVLARWGLGSRREIERWIVAGRLQCNGKIIQLGDHYAEGQALLLDGKVITPPQVESKALQLLLYHKPEGEICSRHDPEGRPTVFARLPRLEGERWVMVGRLDINTSGLLLFTTDGALANRLMHPRYQVERAYAVRVFGNVTAAQLQALREGVELDDGPAKFESIIEKGGQGRNRWYEVTLREGRYHEVRRLWASQGVEVSRLIRIRYAGISLPRDLKTGQYRYLKADVLSSKLI